MRKIYFQFCLLISFVSLRICCSNSGNCTAQHVAKAHEHVARAKQSERESTARAEGESARLREREREREQRVHFRSSNFDIAAGRLLLLFLL